MGAYFLDLENPANVPSPFPGAHLKEDKIRHGNIHILKKCDPLGPPFEIHQWICSAIHASQQPTSPIGFLSLKLPPPPCAGSSWYIFTYILFFIGQALGKLDEACTNREVHWVALAPRGQWNVLDADGRKHRTLRLSAMTADDVSSCPPRAKLAESACGRQPVSSMALCIVQAEQLGSPS